MEREQITVHFRVFPDGDVIALWEQGEPKLGSYMHVGQHGDASRELLTELDKAKPRQFLALLDELERIGYSVTVAG